MGGSPPWAEPVSAGTGVGGRRRKSQQLLAAARSSSEKLGDLILKRLDAPLPRLFSPFSRAKNGEGSARDAQLVLAYELRWRAVKGFDFRNPLCYGGRVVLEMGVVVKRQFDSVARAYAHYLGAVAEDDAFDVRELPG